MSEWPSSKLAEVAEIRFSNVDKKSHAYELPVQLCNYMDVYANDYITKELDFMAASAARSELERFRVKKGDVMLTKDSETPDDIGISSVVVDDIPNLVCGYHLALIKPNPTRVDSIYLSKHLSSQPVARYFSRVASGSTRYGLSTKSIASACFPLAPIDQQRRIAEILSTVDEAIEQTEALIEKYRKIKAGMMQDLFTRGVTPDGKLRPPRSEAPDLYKPSELGWIPKEWDCPELETLLAKTFSPMRSGPFGSSLLKSELAENGIPFLGIDNIFVERFEPTFKRFVPRKKFQQLLKYSVFPGDVVITIMGTVGRCCVVPENIAQALSSKHLWTMTFDREQIAPELVCWQLNYAPWVKIWFTKQSQGAVMDAIQSSTLKRTRLMVPQPEEQVKILDRYQGLLNLIAAEEQNAAKLRLQKQGLMQDLLTGKVPVH
jgi:type I restriction enzyme S subunit